MMVKPLVKKYYIRLDATLSEHTHEKEKKNIQFVKKAISLLLNPNSHHRKKS